MADTPPPGSREPHGGQTGGDPPGSSSEQPRSPDDPAGGGARPESETTWAASWSEPSLLAEPARPPEPPEPAGDSGRVPWPEPPESAGDAGRATWPEPPESAADAGSAPWPEPPAWVAPTPPPPGGPKGAQPADSASLRRPVLVAAVVGALVGALVAGLLVAALDDGDGFTAPAAQFSSNTSKIARPADIQEILAKVQPAVVAIRTRTLDLGDFLAPAPTQGAGTGFVISPDGVIVTNAHVLEGSGEIDVIFGNDRELPARILGKDAASDLAVIKVEAEGLPVAVLGDSDELRVGDDVVAIGNALSLRGGPTVTRGIVSAKDRTIMADNNSQLDHMIQTDTAINPGNSGGPLVNSAGEVVGINTAVAGNAQNIGFSIAITQARPLIEDLRAGRVQARALLGVNMIPVTPDIAQQLGVTADDGAAVVRVVPGSGADRGGIEAGDIIVRMDGETVRGPSDVSRVVRNRQPGDVLDIVVLRRGGRAMLTVTLGEGSPGPG